MLRQRPFAAQAYAQAVIESAIEAVITIDKLGIVETFNNAAQRIFGYEIHTVAHQHCRLLVSTSFYREFEQYFRNCRDKNIIGPSAGEVTGVKKDGTQFPMHLSISAVKDGEEAKFVLLIRDLSRQRAAEKEVREQREILAHVDRLNTLGEMTAGIAHEINQPLTAISMYAQTGLRLLKSDLNNVEKLTELFEKLSTQAHRTGSVIERMQQMTRQRESQQETIDSEALINEVHRLAEVEAQLRNIIIVSRTDQHLPKVNCDPIQIQQVILNLLRNGMQAMSNASHRNENKIILRAQKNDTGVKISIIDTGGGVSNRMANQLYQPFSTSKEDGMGLGLSISRSIIAAHGGRLEYLNNSTGGATFFFTLPLIVEN